MKYQHQSEGCRTIVLSIVLYEKLSHNCTCVCVDPVWNLQLGILNNNLLFQINQHNMACPLCSDAFGGVVLHL